MPSVKRGCFQQLLHAVRLPRRVDAHPVLWAADLEPGVVERLLGRVLEGACRLDPLGEAVELTARTICPGMDGVDDWPTRWPVPLVISTEPACSVGCHSCQFLEGQIAVWGATQVRRHRLKPIHLEGVGVAVPGSRDYRRCNCMC